MILVTLGTQDKSFVRLLTAIQKAIDAGDIKDEVIVQAGLTAFTSADMQIFDLVPADEFNALMQRADLIITHGGVGTIIAALKASKVIIAAPRLKRYGEHTNDHQMEIIRELSKQGCLIPLWEMEELPACLKTASNFAPQPFVSNTAHLVAYIRKYLKTLQE